MSHTPGKWEVREPFSYKLDGASIWVVQPTGSMLVAQVAGLAGFDYSNAKIISTAPDGLAIAEKLCNLWAVSQSEESVTFARNEMEELFKMASALREKASAK